MDKQQATKPRHVSLYHEQAKEWTQLTFKVPKECLPLLEALITKVPPAFHSPTRFKGELIRDALHYLNQNSPGGLCCNGGQGWRPATPDDVGGFYKKPGLRLLP